MIRKLLRTLGAFKTSILITIAAVLSSILLYIVAGIFFINFSPAGIIMSTLLPAMVAPFLSYFLLKLLVKLDFAELALAKINDELEERVQHRTAELLKANEDLKNEIDERLHAEKRIQASLREKEVLLKEIHHRVKNNLQIVDSLLNLQHGSIQNTTSRNLLKKCRNRIRSMALIHEKLYQSKTMSEISFSEYVRTLTSHLYQSYGVDKKRVKFKAVSSYMVK